jgi:pyruvate dehydrogenase (quinone)
MQPFSSSWSPTAQMPEVLHRAMRSATGKRGVTVIVIPGDVALAELPADDIAAWPVLSQSRVLRPRRPEGECDSRHA